MTVEDLEKAIQKLPPADLARFRAWYEAFDAAQFDRQIEGDMASGKTWRAESWTSWRSKPLPIFAQALPANDEAFCQSRFLDRISKIA